MTCPRVKARPREPLVAAALRPHRARSAAAGRRAESARGADGVAEWVLEAAAGLQQGRRRLELARGRGWTLSAVRLEGELRRQLGRLHDRLQSALPALPCLPPDP